jgi:hypothetical protein
VANDENEHRINRISRRVWRADQLRTQAHRIHVFSANAKVTKGQAHSKDAQGVKTEEQEMTPTKINQTIAEACGLKDLHCLSGQLCYDSIHSHPVPNYHADLNAMHEAEKVLTSGDHKRLYFDWLGRLAYLGATTRECATAPQRCEAFLRTLGLWEDGE